MDDNDKKGHENSWTKHWYGLQQNEVEKKNPYRNFNSLGEGGWLRRRRI